MLSFFFLINLLLLPMIFLKLNQKNEKCNSNLHQIKVCNMFDTKHTINEIILIMKDDRLKTKWYPLLAKVEGSMHLFLEGKKSWQAHY